MYKQVIIARKDLNMSAGKLAAQIAHGSMAFISEFIIKNASHVILPIDGKEYYYCSGGIDVKLFDEWFKRDFTKVILQAKNKNHLLRAAERAEELGMKKGEDFFIIKDKCYTELSPEEPDGTTITVIGFRPMAREDIRPISQKYQLWKG